MFVNIGYELLNNISACRGNPQDFILRKNFLLSHDIKEIRDIIGQSILQPLAHIFSVY